MRRLEVREQATGPGADRARSAKPGQRLVARQPPRASVPPGSASHRAKRARAVSRSAREQQSHSSAVPSPPRRAGGHAQARAQAALPTSPNSRQPSTGGRARASMAPSKRLGEGKGARSPQGEHAPGWGNKTANDVHRRALRARNAPRLRAAQSLPRLRGITSSGAGDA